ncbi:methyl-accepting chemotaxis protein [Xanthomonas nasturtii]|uniref:Methyl-accepting chemotaxis protein n=2 Tax=Xanthomonas nasturtii TaxID=1843581 RepID=A0A3E1KRX4_9XANT|nr:methyl-accepting chemotaxis protein [Xanthomonas nasturtii]MCL1530563.1 methyl-accepting chemotaxis protein [Xanthomonas nasturtii]MCL1568245.1 methyl-accepting chemotaxis protein [Xanthomonas nasturtii]MCL1572071.1 methyl-accepting chemotaxis protein [Xanthomonas nasturtii]MCL1583555.1 methyl-accepting chemotaxis protein [Xanthomonas nasturtii]RFF42357.1 methyl-accepting chemotaxis protein [Xanthomonas nasturtii]
MSSNASRFSLFGWGAFLRESGPLTRWLRYVSIRSKILMLPSIALLGLLLYSVYSISASRTNIKTLERFASNTLPVMSLAAQANQGLIETQATFTQALGDKDEFLVEDATKLAQTVRTKIDSIKDKDPAYAKRVTELVALWDRYVDKSRLAVGGIISGTGDMQSFQALAVEKQAAYQQVREALNTLGSDSETSFKNALNEAAVQATRATWIGASATALLLVLTVLAALLIEAAIRRPIERLNQAIGKVARGDFDVHVEDEGKDALSTMCRSFNALLMDLKAAINETNQVLAAVGRGDFSQRVGADLPGELGGLKQGVNAGADSVQRTMQALDAVMDALAKGDFAARMSEDVPGESRLKVDRAMHLLQESLEELSASMTATAEGNFKRRIHAELPGDLGALKQAVNQSLDALDLALSEIGATTAALADGDLTRRVEGRYAGKLGELTSTLNGSLDSLREVISEVATTAEDVSNGADEISSGNSDLSGRTERQAAALEQSAASIKSLLESARQAAENSRQTSELTVGALDNSRSGSEIVSKAGDSMEGINQSSRRIADIIGLIDSVAFQTNLLALNAAVEAARAGEQGRGFAVVATEVRNLAHRTASSAKEIRDLISDSSQRVHEGTDLVASTRMQLEAINTSNERVAQLSREAAAAAQDQSAGLQELSRAVDDLESVNQQNSSLVEEVAASSDSLRERAMHLRTAVARFRLRATDADQQAANLTQRVLERARSTLV